MSVFYSIVLYMAISGAFLGGFIDTNAEECGPVSVDKELIITSMAWPLIASAVIFSDSKNIKQSKCKGEE